MAMTRRLLFEAAGAAVLGFVFIRGNRYACTFVARNHPDFFALLQAAPGDPTALELGKAALASSHTPKSLAAIEAALRTRPLIRQAIATSCARSRAELVRDACAEDFHEGRTVTLDGWLLSETEAAICAAKALAVA